MLPAYAGMIRGAEDADKAFLGAPRVCGDDPRYVDYRQRVSKCSPRMRG